MTQAEKEERIERQFLVIKEQAQSVSDNPNATPYDYMVTALTIALAGAEIDLLISTPSDEKLKEWGARPATLNKNP